MTESSNFYALIMAGGGGTRLWPLSRRHRPKQLLRLFGEKTLFQVAVDRLKALFPIERILVITNQMQAEELRKQCPQLLSSNFLLEPQARGTAPAICLAAAYLEKIDPGAVMAVLTADHYIGNEEIFVQYLRAAKELALKGHLLTLGIEPSYAATQYGYIQQGEQLEYSDYGPAFAVKRFKEKPNEREAKIMLEEGDHSWNSGMFIWQANQILAEFKRQLPKIHKDLNAITADWKRGAPNTINKKLWAKIEAQTIDYGIMENAQKVAVIPAMDLQWNDVGSWNSLFEVLKPDKDGNVVVGEKHININSHDTLVYTNDQKKMVVTIGTQDLVVVDTGDILLICTKDQAQDVRQIIELLKENNLNNYL